MHREVQLRLRRRRRRCRGGGRTILVALLLVFGLRGTRSCLRLVSTNEIDSVRDRDLHQCLHLGAMDHARVFSGAAATDATGTRIDLVAVQELFAIGTRHFEALFGRFVDQIHFVRREIAVLVVVFVRQCRREVDRPERSEAVLKSNQRGAVRRSHDLHELFPLQRAEKLAKGSHAHTESESGNDHRGHPPESCTMVPGSMRA